MLYQPVNQPTGNRPILVVSFGHECFQDQAFRIDD
jgi:hypothetical protein